MIAVLSGVSLAIFIMMCFLAIAKPHWAVILIFSFFGYEQLLSSYITVLGRNTWIINVVTGLVAGTALITTYLYGTKPFKGVFNLNSLLVGLLIVFAIFGFTYSRMPSAAIYFIKSGTPYFALMLVVLPSLINSPDLFRKLTTPLLVVGCSLITLILISPRTQFYGMRMFIDLSYTTGANARGNPLAIAEFGGLMIIIASLMNPEKKSIYITGLRIASIALGIIICFLAATRGQLVFAVFVSILLYPIANKIENINQFFLRAGSVCGIILLNFVIAKLFLFNTDSAGRFTVSDLATSMDSRMYFATSLLSEYAANPSNYIQGLGTGSFNAIVVHDGEGYLYPHNLIVEVLGHHGLIGLALLLGIFIITGRHAYKLVRMAGVGLVDRSGVAIVIALSAYTTLIAMKQGSFMLVPIPFYMYLIISKLYTRAIFEQQSEDMYLEHSESEYDDYENYGDEY